MSQEKIPRVEGPDELNRNGSLTVETGVGEVSRSNHLEPTGEMSSNDYENSSTLMEENRSLDENESLMDVPCEGSNERNVESPGEASADFDEVNPSGFSSSSSNSAITTSIERDLSLTLQKLSITPDARDCPSLNGIIQSGALKKEQITEAVQEETDDIDIELDNSSAEFSDGEEEETQMKIPDENTPILVTGFPLRPYQKELAIDALSGKNTIICAPTGSGKTRVAIEIIVNHLNGGADAIGNPRKVCFFARTVPLAVQQHKTIKKNLPKGKKISIFTGTIGFSSDMHLLLKDLDVVILTPMTLQNHISRGNVKGVDEFSLLVFDECHHTMEKEPYNILMASYVHKKLKREHNDNLPQVVGLTASFPMMKAENLDKATEKILQLCANLDAERISVVDRHRDDLRKCVPVPSESTELLKERVNAKSYKVISDVMEKLEEKANRCAKDLGDDTIMRTVGKFHRDARKSQKYNNWTVELSDLVVLFPPWCANTREKSIARRLLFFIAHYLMNYNSALEMHDLVHLDDVIKYLEICFAEHKNTEYQPKSETELYNNFSELKERLQSLDRSCRVNPNLDVLVKVIDEKLLKVGTSSRGIIFVRTRAIAVALAAWLDRCEREDIRKLNASFFTGTNAKYADGGISQVEQNALFEKFKEGKVRLLVATSVAEEGLDISQCNLVIKYNHVGNEITTIQTRGRSRTVDGHCVLLAMDEICKKEVINQKRTKFMYGGIDEVRKMDSEEFGRRVKKYQEEDNQKRCNEEETKKRNKDQYKDTKFILKCKRCATFTIHSDNIRTYSGHHRVVVDMNVWKGNKIFIVEKENLGEIHKVGQVRCDAKIEDDKICRGPLGALIYFNSNYFLAVKLKNFVLYEETENQPRKLDKTPKKWNDVPYTLQELSQDDIKNYIKMYTAPSSGGSGTHGNESGTAGDSNSQSVASLDQNTPRKTVNTGSTTTMPDAPTSVSMFDSSSSHHETEQKTVVE